MSPAAAGVPVGRAAPAGAGAGVSGAAAYWVLVDGDVLGVFPAPWNARWGWVITEHNGAGRSASHCGDGLEAVRSKLRFAVDLWGLQVCAAYHHYATQLQGRTICEHVGLRGWSAGE